MGSRLKGIKEFPGKAEWEVSQGRALHELMDSKELIRVDYPTGYLTPENGPVFSRPDAPRVPIALHNAFFMPGSDVALEPVTKVWEGEGSLPDGVAKVSQQGVTDGWKSPPMRAISFSELKRGGFLSIVSDPREVRRFVLTGVVLQHEGVDWYPVIDRAFGENDRVGADLETRENTGRFLRFQRVDRLAIEAHRSVGGLAVIFGKVRPIQTPR